MLVFDLARLSLCSMLAAAPAPAAATIVMDSTVVTQTDTVQPVFTTDGLAKFTAFVGAYFKLPQPVRDSAKNYRMMVPMSAMHITRLSNSPELPPFNATDMTSLAKNNATVAATFKTAGITPEEYARWRRALTIALVTFNTDRAINGEAGALDTSTTVGKNANFIKTHQTEMTALTTAGMQFPNYQLQLTPNAPAGGIPAPTLPPQGGVPVPPGGVPVPAPAPTPPPNK